jgi:phage shock protein PspC (stress-responsive transcriptional regulator)
MALAASRGPSSRRMGDDTPRASEQDVERELRAHVADREGSEAPEPGVPPPSRPRLHRRASGKWVAGVAGGLADHWGVPASLIRIPFAIAGSALVLRVLSGGGSDLDPSDGIVDLVVTASFTAVAAYFVLWLVLPREDLARSPAGRVVDRYPGIRSFPGFVLLVIGGAILADRLGIWEPDVVIAIALIAVGIWLFRREATEIERRATGVAPSAGPGETEEPTPSRHEWGSTLRPPRPPRERSPLGWIVFGAALLVMCVAAIWSFSDDNDIEHVAAIPALGLLVLSAGLVVASVYGRGRWLILPALLITPVVLVSSLIRVPIEGRVGDAFYRPHNLGEFNVAGYSNSVGSMHVDLVRFAGRNDVERELWLTTAVGTVTIVVPYDAHVRVDASTGLGTLSLGPQGQQGMEISDAARLDPRHGDGATFTFHVDVGIGDVHVLRYAATKRQLRELREERRAERVAERASEREAGAP